MSSCSTVMMDQLNLSHIDCANSLNVGPGLTHPIGTRQKDGPVDGIDMRGYLFGLLETACQAISCINVRLYLYEEVILYCLGVSVYIDLENAVAGYTQSTSAMCDFNQAPALSSKATNLFASYLYNYNIGLKNGYPCKACGDPMQPQEGPCWCYDVSTPLATIQVNDAVFLCKLLKELENLSETVEAAINKVNRTCVFAKVVNPPSTHVGPVEIEKCVSDCYNTWIGAYWDCEHAKNTNPKLVENCKRQADADAVNCAWECKHHLIIPTMHNLPHGLPPHVAASSQTQGNRGPSRPHALPRVASRLDANGGRSQPLP